MSLDELKQETDNSYDATSLIWTCRHCSHIEKKKRSNFLAHLRTHLPKNIEVFTCPTCGSTFTLRGTLARHLKEGSSRCRDGKSVTVTQYGGTELTAPPPESAPSPPPNFVLQDPLSLSLPEPAEKHRLSYILC